MDNRNDVEADFLDLDGFRQAGAEAGSELVWCLNICYCRRYDPRIAVEGSR